MKQVKAEENYDEKKANKIKKKQIKQVKKAFDIIKSENPNLGKFIMKDLKNQEWVDPDNLQNVLIMNNKRGCVINESRRL